jgi:hypothetical protein
MTKQDRRLSRLLAGIERHPLRARSPLTKFLQTHHAELAPLIAKHGPKVLAEELAAIGIQMADDKPPTGGAVTKAWRRVVARVSSSESAGNPVQPTNPDTPRRRQPVEVRPAALRDEPSIPAPVAHQPTPRPPSPASGDDIERIREAIRRKTTPILPMKKDE